MSENHEDVLANFQSITGIDDVAEAIYHLEECNWDLLTAVNRILPQEPVEPIPNIEPLNRLDSVISTRAESPSAQLHRNIFGIDSATLSALERVTKENESNDMIAHSSSSSSSTSNSNMLNGDHLRNSENLKFNINHNFDTSELIISDRSTVGDLRNKIFNLTSIPICRQVLHGWTNENYTNSTKLSTLNLASENELIVMDSMKDEGGADDSSVDRLTSTYTLNILNEKNGKSLQLKFPGTHSVLDVKRDVYAVTNIAVRHQEWLGWPKGTTDITPIALTGIAMEHDFTLKSTESQTRTAESSLGTDFSNENLDIDTDSSVDEFEDASDFNGEEDVFNSSSIINIRRTNNLIPDGTDNERLGCLEFVQNYVERYGDPHPSFFAGTLEEAFTEAFQKPAKDRKLLAIYLHHDGSVLTNVFCDHLMKCDTIMQTLEHNFILYGWDLTNESNKNLFLSSLMACAGSTALITVRNTPANRLPAILIIGKIRRVCEVLSVIYGNVGVDELLNKLMDTMKLYSDQRDVEIREEDERTERELVKMEQDAAYHESLEADRRKEEAKLQKERAIANERQRLESERQEIEAIREMNRLEADQRVLPEPASDAIGITKIRIRMPNGEFIERRFAGESPLNALLIFIASKGFPIDEYKVISSWPRRDLTTLDKNESLQQLRLCPQETVILEER